jgi:hypothetical protein
MTLSGLARLRALPWVGRLGRLTRRHLLIGVVLVVAVAARVVAMLGYPPIRYIPDSWSYLAAAMRMGPSRVRPAGYPAMLWLLKPFHSLVLVAGIQHAMGVGIGIMVYALLRHRFRLPGWGATLAALPVLVSAFAIQVEHYAISDTLFTFLLTVALTLVLWRPVPAVWMCALVGLLLAAATLVRTEALPLVIPFLVYLVTRFLGWRTLAAGLAMGGAFAIPVLGYASWFQRANGTFDLTTSSGVFLYARVAPFADCAKIKPPPDERRLCLQVPVSQRQVSPYYVWHSSSPIVEMPGGQFGNLANRLGTDFAVRAIMAQPLDYLAAVWHDTWQAFSSSPNTSPYRSIYVFQATMEPRLPAGSFYDRVLRAYNVGDPYPHVVEPYGSWIGAYQRFVVIPGIPGPLFGLITLTGLIGVVAAWRRCGGPAVLPWLIGVMLIVEAAATAGFDARYVQFGFWSLCVAAAIGVKEIVDRFVSTRADPAPGQTACTPDMAVP